MPFGLRIKTEEIEVARSIFWVPKFLGNNFNWITN